MVALSVRMIMKGSHSNLLLRRYCRSFGHQYSHCIRILIFGMRDAMMQYAICNGGNETTRQEEAVILYSVCSYSLYVVCRCTYWDTFGTVPVVKLHTWKARFSKDAACVCVVHTSSTNNQWMNANRHTRPCLLSNPSWCHDRQMRTSYWFCWSISQRGPLTIE